MSRFSLTLVRRHEVNEIYEDADTCGYRCFVNSKLATGLTMLAARLDLQQPKLSNYSVTEVLIVYPNSAYVAATP
jgi:hypothetical protein